MSQMKDGIGDRFQKETKYQRGQLKGISLRWDQKPETYKHYPSAPKIQLDPPEKKNGPPLWEVIRRRRSRRNFQDKPLPKENLSQILWATQGITAQAMGHELRAAPSAGALYPVETYCIVHHVQNIEAGIYHYAVREHQLEQMEKGDFRQEIALSALNQKMAFSANVVFVWTGIFQRSKWKYQQRAYRYVYLDAGHIGQNLALAATGLGLGSCQMAALYDPEVNSLLGVDGVEESVLYLSAVGFPQ